MNMTNAGIMIDKKRWINSAHDAFSFLRRHVGLSQFVEMIGLFLHHSST